MLVLTRKIGESIQIGNDVVVTVLACKGNQVRLGVIAPRSTSVQRIENEAVKLNTPPADITDT